MLTTDIMYLKGVGPKRAEKLNKIGINTIEDLLNYFPVKYEDRRVLTKINNLDEDKKYLIRVKIIQEPTVQKLNKKLSILKTVGKDETGSVNIVFFNQVYLKDKIINGEWYYLYGKCKCEFNRYEFTSPDIENAKSAIRIGKIIPIYGLTNNLTNNEMINIINNAIENNISTVTNVLPNELINKYELLDKKDAIRFLHFPPNGTKYKLAKKTIAFEKLLILQLGLLYIKRRINHSDEGLVFNNDILCNKLIESIPYNLTGAQSRVIEEIKSDMGSNKTMNRLVQGDVGSGKTVVAIVAMLYAVGSGYQASMMAPTEILARQHFDTINEYISNSNMDIKVGFLAGSSKSSEKKKILERLKSGDIDILVGTHALIENNVEFNNIGIVITDEQHRFGVRQRAMLSNKGKNPDILVMTATPIPRTLALMFYGDLDISVIDEMPPNRQEIKTYSISGSKKSEAYDFIKRQINEGRQAYIVAPLIEDSEKLELDSAEEIYNTLSNNYFKDYKLGLLHGKMKNSEKDAIMDEFYSGNIDVLVSTTVIEVGVNVPNAVVMMILNSERFGLAQLHQLRGRVGRGKHQSYCILVNESKSKKSKDRMSIMTSTNNGFIIAEEDLKIRGPGDFFGTRQHGLTEYISESLIGDMVTVQDVQLLSKQIVEEGCLVNNKEYKNLKYKILCLFNDENIVFN